MSTNTEPVTRMDDGMAFDPMREPELFDGVRTRRSLAFLIDATVILVLMGVAAIVILVLGIVTLGLAWLLYAILFPLVALGYVGMTMGGPASATWGMRLFDLEMRLWDGRRMDLLLAVLHALIFWFSISILTPLVLAFALFNPRKRLLHDILVGAVMIRSSSAPIGQRVLPPAA